MEFRDQDPQDAIDQEPTVKKHPSKAILAIIAALALLAASIVWYALGIAGSRDRSAPEPTGDRGGASAQTQPAPAASGGAHSEVKTVSVEAGNFYFKPAEIRAKKGDTVRIVMASRGMTHNLVLDEFGFRVPLTQAGGTSRAEFVADRTGTFEFYCSVGSHRQQGQVGKLIVEG